MPKKDPKVPKQEKPKTILIQGITQAGKKFRPSNWAERMSGKLSTFKNHRIYYSPLLHPVTYNGHKCMLVDQKLEQVNPELYQSILNFARNNKLSIQNPSPEEEEDK